MSDRKPVTAQVAAPDAEASPARNLRAQLAAPWRAPVVVVARHALLSYLRGGWLWGEALVVLAIFAITFRPFTVNSDNFFGVAILTLGALAFVGTIVLVRRGMRARAYLSLARLPSRGAYIRGLALAAGALRIPLYLQLLALELLSRGLLDPSPQRLLIGSAFLLLETSVLSALALLLTPPITTRIAWIVVLAWLVGALTSYTQAPFATWLTPLQLPLQPFIACFTIATTGALTWSNAWAPALAVVYFAAFVAFAQARFARRDLVLR
jgi:hypothetical protein